MFQLARYIVLLLLLPFVFGLDQQHAENTRALIYLMKYGYVDSSEWSSSLVTEEALKGFVSKAVQDFQAFAGLNQTGKLDAVTKEYMTKPRCGVRDIIGQGATARRKRDMLYKEVVGRRKISHTELPSILLKEVFQRKM